MRRERLHQKYASAVSHGSRFSPAIAAIIARNHRQVIVLPFCRIQSLARDKLAQTQLDPFPSPSTGPILLSKNYPQTPFIVSPCYRFTISFRSYFSTIYSPCKKVFDYERSGCVSDQRSVFEHRPLPCDLAHFDRDFYLEPSGLDPLPVTRLFVEIFFRPLFTRLSKRPARVASARVSWFHGQFVPTSCPRIHRGRRKVEGLPKACVTIGRRHQVTLLVPLRAAKSLVILKYPYCATLNRGQG